MSDWSSDVCSSDLDFVLARQLQQMPPEHIARSRIDQWFDEQASPDLRDAKARRFREIYERARKASRDPAEIVEAVYNALAEGDFRRSTRRANAVYAVTAYFFDSCDIFEAPPIGAPGGETHATADQRD